MMDWLDTLVRLLLLAGMIAGAYRSWRNLGAPFRFEGRIYRRDRRGNITSRWGVPIRDVEVAARLDQVGAVGS